MFLLHKHSSIPKVFFSKRFFLPLHIFLVGKGIRRHYNASEFAAVHINTLFYLPHLQNHEEGLVANVHLGKGRSGG